MCRRRNLPNRLKLENDRPHAPACNRGVLFYASARRQAFDRRAPALQTGNRTCKAVQNKRGMKIRIDPFLALMIVAVAAATFFPATGAPGEFVSQLGALGVSLLFFLHGAVLAPKAVLSGLKQWRLHLFIFATTFLVFPVAVLPFGLLPESLLPPDLYLGFLYLAVLPSAVSSSIAFTALARGNVPAAICNSAGSNVFGLLLTPLLLGVLLGASLEGGAEGWMDTGQALRDVTVQLLLPFGLGQAVHRWAGGFLARHKRRLDQYDQLVIVLIVYAAFSRSAAAGLWEALPPFALLAAVVLCTVLLLAVFAFTIYGARGLGFPRADEIAAVFCGSKKSLASGMPLAQILFSSAPGFGMVVLPIMFYNQIQILIGVVLARRYARAGVERGE